MLEGVAAAICLSIFLFSVPHNLGRRIGLPLETPFAATRHFIDWAWLRFGGGAAARILEKRLNLDAVILYGILGSQPQKLNYVAKIQSTADISPCPQAAQYTSRYESNVLVDV
jgi:hypothetical protein